MTHAQLTEKDQSSWATRDLKKPTKDRVKILHTLP